MTNKSCILIPIIYGIIGFYCMLNDKTFIEGLGMYIVSITSILHHYMPENTDLYKLDTYSNYMLFTFFVFIKYHWFYKFGVPIVLLGYLSSIYYQSFFIHVLLVHFTTLVMFLMISQEM